jgi:predicted phosphate transport protein (TIGR00153 family)
LVARFSLIPREEKFYADFEAMATEIHQAAGLLGSMLAADVPVWDKADEIKELEHRCDTLTHQIIQRLHRTFVTPIDREDIFSLARSLDDVMDAIDDAASLMRLYRIESIRFGARELARIIVQSTDQLRQAMRSPENRQHVEACAVEINRLENEGDRIYPEAVRQLFEDERDPIVVMKWKEILDFLEAATDRCEDVANVLEGVVVKHA